MHKKSKWVVTPPFQVERNTEYFSFQGKDNRRRPVISYKKGLKFNFKGYQKSVLKYDTRNQKLLICQTELRTLVVYYRTLVPSFTSTHVEKNSIHCNSMFPIRIIKLKMYNYYSSSICSRLNFRWNCLEKMKTIHFWKA